MEHIVLAGTINLKHHICGDFVRKINKKYGEHIHTQDLSQ